MRPLHCPSLLHWKFSQVLVVSFIITDEPFAAVLFCLDSIGRLCVCLHVSRIVGQRSCAHECKCEKFMYVSIQYVEVYMNFFIDGLNNHCQKRKRWLILYFNCRKVRILLVCIGIMFTPLSMHLHTY